MAGLREGKEDWLTEEGGNLTLFKKSNPANGPKVTAVTHQINCRKNGWFHFLRFYSRQDIFSQR